MASAITSYSKFYGRKPYWYSWDVWDERKEAIERAGQLTLVQKDTRRQATIKAAVLLPLLTEDRRTSRFEQRSTTGKGNWGLYVRPNRPDEIQIEGGKRGNPALLPVRWQEPPPSTTR